MPHPNSGQAFPADADIIERIRAGDESALRIIEQKYGAYLLKIKNILEILLLSNCINWINFLMYCKHHCNLLSILTKP